MARLLLTLLLGLLGILCLGLPPALLRQWWLLVPLAYGFVAPLATLVEHMSRDESQFYKVLKTVLLASQQGYSPQIAVEFGRKAIFASERPSFKELEDHVKRK